MTLRPPQNVNQPTYQTCLIEKQFGWARSNGHKQLGVEVQPEYEEEEYEEEDSVIRCTCNYNHDNYEMMIQCDKCKVWQHSTCVGIKDAPEHYFCEKCRPLKIRCICNNNLDFSRALVKCIRCNNFSHNECVGLPERPPKRYFVCRFCLNKQQEQKKLQEKREFNVYQPNRLLSSKLLFLNSKQNLQNLKNQQNLQQFKLLENGNESSTTTLLVRKRNAQQLSSKDRDGNFNLDKIQNLNCNLQNLNEQKRKRTNNNKFSNQQKRTEQELEQRNDEIVLDRKMFTIIHSSMIDERNQNQKKTIAKLNSNSNHNHSSNCIYTLEKTKTSTTLDNRRITNNHKETPMNGANYSGLTNGDELLQEQNRSVQDLVGIEAPPTIGTFNGHQLSGNDKQQISSRSVFKSQPEQIISQNNFNKNSLDIKPTTKYQLENASLELQQRQQQLNDLPSQNSNQIENTNLIRNQQMLHNQALIQKRKRLYWKRTGIYDDLFYQGFNKFKPLVPSSFEIDKGKIVQLFVKQKQKDKKFQETLEKTYFNQKKKPNNQNKFRNLKKNWINNYHRLKEEKKRKKKIERKRLEALERKMEVKEEKKKLASLTPKLNKKKFSLSEYRKKRATSKTPQLTTQRISSNRTQIKTEPKLKFKQKLEPLQQQTLQQQKLQQQKLQQKEGKEKEKANRQELKNKPKIEPRQSISPISVSTNISMPTKTKTSFPNSSIFQSKQKTTNGGINSSTSDINSSSPISNMKSSIRNSQANTSSNYSSKQQRQQIKQQQGISGREYNDLMMPNSKSPKSNKITQKNFRSTKTNRIYSTSNVNYITSSHSTNDLQAFQQQQQQMNTEKQFKSRNYNDYPTNSYNRLPRNNSSNQLRKLNNNKNRSLSPPTLQTELSPISSSSLRSTPQKKSITYNKYQKKNRNERNFHDLTKFSSSNNSILSNGSTLTRSRSSSSSPLQQPQQQQQQQPSTPLSSASSPSSSSIPFKRSNSSNYPDYSAHFGNNNEKNTIRSSKRISNNNSLNNNLNRSNDFLENNDDPYYKRRNYPYPNNRRRNHFRRSNFSSSNQNLNNIKYNNDFDQRRHNRVSRFNDRK
ncbi:histone deacetylase complex subunit cti6 [Anaeramoeba flamelloides]|uniref:Histone deacetylase complex subunit cti6 n=1 Tax=Anaeramoeba flamelloides TaxID=1746091 RepID=A0AAV7ZBG3_9EUKA|nr:histone deacetylase complex subunit cti6 [Anaeramoeba flamelloides]